MTKTHLEPSTQPEQRQRALARWDGEGGAGPEGPQKRDVPEVLSRSAIGPLVLEQHDICLGLAAQDLAERSSNGDTIITKAHASRADVSGEAATAPSSGHPIPVRA